MTSRPSLPVRRLVATLALLLPLTVAAPARATTDGGQSVRLLAVAGQTTRYAVAVEEEVQAACGLAACRVFLIPVGKPAARERVLVVKPGQGDIELGAADLRTRFLRSLPPALRRDLDATWEPVGKLAALPPGDPGKGLALPGWGTASMTLQAQGRSAAATVCWDPACVACKGRAGGGRLAGWCKPPVKLEGNAQTCACDARPVTLNLTLALAPEPGKAARIVGAASPLVADPRTFGQNAMAGCRGADCTALGLDVKVYRTTRDELVIVGAAVHARQANGTYLPVFGALRLVR
jgi:hypothetical protein